jgi:protein phosphatase
MLLEEGRDTSEALRKPSDEEIDVYGLTHVGRVRDSNQDHFLIGSLRKQAVIHQTSLPDTSAFGELAERAAFVAVVADGAGGDAGGEHASRHAVEAVMRYVALSMQCYYAAGVDDATFAESLRAAAMRCHDELLERAEADYTLRGMATTLTLWLGVWPRSYLLQVGDSRCYQLRDGVLTQISRDQTMAQELVDLGVLPQVEAASPRLMHTLSSAIGGPQTAPTVTGFEQRWGDVGLLCSDGLIRHVSNERIAERLRTMRSARQACEDLLQDALDAGGTDNITVLVGRTLQRD